MSSLVVDTWPEPAAAARMGGPACCSGAVRHRDRHRSPEGPGLLV